MPGRYEGLGLSFLYPESWQLETEGESVALESSEGAFLSISRFGNPAETSTALHQALATMQEEYEEIERDPVARKLADLQLSGYLLRFVYLDLIVTSQLLTFTNNDQAYLVQIQAEDRDHERLGQVFDAILASICATAAH